ncbi:hypothetical protein D3D01_22165 [Haloarcula sp. Atlit-7R]|nr:hypothetical protein [Haloarcula sp. Atlit-7R]RLM88018.1 hypothetical protein D3D01_22165 [Haloarcula sp. Atlit-7R]
MPRGMDERFEDPSEEAEDEEVADDDNETAEATSETERQDREPAAATEEQSGQEKSAGSADTKSPTEEATETDDEPLNIREDWDSATIYVEPEQSEDIEVTFTRLKKQLKREDVTLEKNKHFYRGIFEVAFGEHREETKEKIRELAQKDIDR